MLITVCVVTVAGSSVTAPADTDFFQTESDPVSELPVHVTTLAVSVKPAFGSEDAKSPDLSPVSKATYNSAAALTVTIMTVPDVTEEKGSFTRTPSTRSAGSFSNTYGASCQILACAFAVVLSVVAPLTDTENPVSPLG
jgi:hypothetical protein